MSFERALVLTDVVDSTRLARELGDAQMARCWAAHDRAARDLLPRWKGREIDKSDGMLLLFETAADALGFAGDYHRALAALGLPLLARAGVHFGAVGLLENSAADVARGAKPLEVEGIAKAITARVMSVAAGGQTLLTAAVREALAPAAAHACRAQGHWRMAGLDDPLELFDDGDGHARPAADGAKAYRVVLDDGLWKPARAIRHSLPAERDVFVGRHAALHSLASTLGDGARLVSVLGMGGAGKTRLALRFAWSWLGEYPGGVWFCDLSQARGLDGILRAVAQGLDLPLGRSDPVLQIGRAIAGRGRCLAIFDNFEQVTRLALETLGAWLDRAAQARFLVTSRERLGLTGEVLLSLEPLPADDAAALFMRRAEAADRSAASRLDGADRAAVEQLVAMLDGLPLAIELAAARIRVMSPRAMLARMHERFSLLKSSQGRQDRQATLRATFDWSWDLLTEAEKAALAQLSVFAGGFTLESAAAVLLLPEAGDEASTLERVAGLVDKSLVRRVKDDRFDLLTSVAAYAAEHLRTPGRYAGSGAVAVIEARARHARFFASLAPQRATEDACIEFDNIVHAQRHAIASGACEVAAATLHNAAAVILFRGPFGLQRELSEAVGAMPGLAGAAKIDVDILRAGAQQFSGSWSVVIALCEAAVDGARAISDREREGRALKIHAETLARSGQGGDVEQARQLFAQALSAANDSGDALLQCTVLNALGSFQESQGQADQARLHYEAGLRIARANRLRRWEGGSAGNLGQCHATLGHAAEALPLYRLAIEIAVELGDRQFEANSRSNLGLLLFEQGRLAEAEAEFDAARATALELGYPRLLAVVRCNLGLVAEARGLAREAETYYQDAVATARDNADRLGEGQYLSYLGLMLARQRRFTEARDSLGQAEDLLEALGDRLSLGILLCHRAEAERLAGDTDAAEAALARAESLSSAMPDLNAESEFGRALQRARPAGLGR